MKARSGGDAQKAEVEAGLRGKRLHNACAVGGCGSPGVHLRGGGNSQRRSKVRANSHVTLHMMAAYFGLNNIIEMEDYEYTHPTCASTEFLRQPHFKPSYGRVSHFVLPVPIQTTPVPLRGELCRTGVGAGACAVQPLDVPRSVPAPACAPRRFPRLGTSTWTRAYQHSWRGWKA